MIGLLCCAVVLPVTRLLDYGLEERRGEEAGELAVGGGVGHSQGSGVGVDRVLFEGRSSVELTFPI